jgi:hypothetical protein
MILEYQIFTRKSLHFMLNISIITALWPDTIIQRKARLKTIRNGSVYFVSNEIKYSMNENILFQGLQDGLEIVETLTESKSAKASGQRKGYVELLAGIREQRYNAILTWAPDRLSRNAGDLGSIVDMMDEGLLVQIRTHGSTFSNNPNEKFLLMILCSQAKLENDNRLKTYREDSGENANSVCDHDACLWVMKLSEVEQSVKKVM